MVDFMVRGLFLPMCMGLALWALVQTGLDWYFTMGPGAHKNRAGAE